MLIPALLSWGGQAYAQQQLSGKVVDNAGVPVIGAMVIVDGTSTGAQTDLDGNFTLKVSEGTPVTLIKGKII